MQCLITCWHSSRRLAPQCPAFVNVHVVPHDTAGIGHSESANCYMYYVSWASSLSWSTPLHMQNWSSLNYFERAFAELMTHSKIEAVQWIRTRWHLRNDVIVGIAQARPNYENIFSFKKYGLWHHTFNSDLHVDIVDPDYSNPSSHSR